MENQQPEALILVNDRPSAIGDDLYQWALDAEDMIRRLHARVEELEAMLDAVGAGGVSAQRVTQAADRIAQDRKIAAAPVEAPKVGSAWRHENGNAYRVVAIANDCDAHSSGRYPVTVVYQGENGKMWARRADDWHRSMTPHDSALAASTPVELPMQPNQKLTGGAAVRFERAVMR